MATKKQLMSAACSIQHKVNGSPDWINRKGSYVIETDQEKIRTAAASCSGWAHEPPLKTYTE